MINERKGDLVATKGKLKKGCGIGCGVFTILVFVIIGSVAFFVRDMSADYKEVGKSEKILLETHGGIADYAPPLGGVPAKERVQVFLDVRRDQAEWRENVALAFEEFLVKKEASADGGFTHFLKLIRSTSEMAPSLAGFWSARNAALLKHEMGAGEYSYLYCLAYYSYLGYDPGDGAHDSELDFGNRSGRNLTVNTNGEMTEEQRKDAAWRRIHELMLPLLKAVDRSGIRLEAREADQWLAELDKEVALLDESPLRYPWRDEAPRQLSDAFRPFRKELEGQYDISVNPVELIFEKIDAE
jgi:hypothetical protein